MLSIPPLCFVFFFCFIPKDWVPSSLFHSFFSEHRTKNIKGYFAGNRKLFILSLFTLGTLPTTGFYTSRSIHLFLIICWMKAEKKEKKIVMRSHFLAERKRNKMDFFFFFLKWLFDSQFCTPHHVKYPPTRHTIIRLVLFGSERRFLHCVMLEERQPGFYHYRQKPLFFQLSTGFNFFSLSLSPFKYIAPSQKYCIKPDFELSFRWLKLRLKKLSKPAFFFLFFFAHRSGNSRF